MPVILECEGNYNNMRGGDPKLPMCPTCKVFFDPYRSGFPGRVKSKYDISITSEHMHLASPRLKEFLDETCTSPIEYFETGGGYFVLRPKREIVLDMRGFMIDGTALCKTCGEPNGVYSDIQGEVKILAGRQPVGPLEMVRSRQRFGERRQRDFLIIIGDQLAESLCRGKFTGLSI
ncbi:hypothetical protein [Xinfangfangia pollutisoli]|uniref:hypothetical protein n=1 Tax=Xinfangfangia pollutisoli TaxID=2865960 RepID=UPI001CD286F0|nr:hypothetical protein [Xinfangfangia pollutisoli]